MCGVPQESLTISTVSEAETKFFGKMNRSMTMEEHKKKRQRLEVFFVGLLLLSIESTERR
jgi:hypothetical protein